MMVLRPLGNYQNPAYIVERPSNILGNYQNGQGTNASKNFTTL